MSGPFPMTPQFCYRATLTSVVDGDTIDVLADLGFGILTKQRLRLVGLNCPEMKTPDGPAAKAFTEMWFTSDKQCVIQTVRDKREKYGRYLARIFDSAGRCLNQDLLTNKLAVPYLE